MDSADDHGLGGSHASCDFRCGIGAAIAIGVKASDPQATAYGDAACDTAEASCVESGPVCAMPSAGVARRAAEGSCNGSSEEFWDSPVLVACIATVPGPDSDPGSIAEDAMRALCEYSNICPGGGGGSNLCKPETELDCDVSAVVCRVLGCPIDPPCQDCLQTLQDTCAGVASTLEGILGSIGHLVDDGTVHAFLATLTDASGSLSVSFDPASGCQVTGTIV